MTNITSRETEKYQAKEHWQTHINQWQSSKLTQQKYCENAEINLSTFVYWRSKLMSGLKNSEEKKFIPVKITPNKTAVETPRTIQIKLLSGHIVYIPTNLEMKLIADLINHLSVPHA